MEAMEELTVIYLILRNLKTFERGFINCLTDKCTSRMFYFPKFEGAEVSFPKCLKFFDSYLHDVEIVKKHFHFQNFSTISKNFWECFQTSEVEYIKVMPIVSNKWNI